MMENHKSESEIAKLISYTKNLIKFHGDCGLDYPYRGEIKSFLETKPEKIPTQNSTPQKNPPVKKPTNKKNKENLDDLTALMAKCQACSLGEKEIGRLLPEGTKKRPLDLLVVCDPQLTEKEITSPIQGEARKLLVKMLAAIDLQIEDTFLTSLLKCLPAKRTAPADEEIKSCLSWLQREVDTLEPKAIITLGPLSAKFILGTKTQLHGLRGRSHKWQDIPLVPSYHPDTLLRYEELKKASWEDLKHIKKIIKG